MIFVTFDMVFWQTFNVQPFYPLTVVINETDISWVVARDAINETYITFGLGPET